MHILFLSQRLAVLLIMASSIVACGGGNSSPTPQPPTALPTVDIGDATVTEGDSASVDISFAVTLSGSATGTVSVGYETRDGTATAGSDYTATNGLIVVPSGSAGIASIVVPILGDTNVEPDETLTVVLTSVSTNAILGKSNAAGIIFDDDSGASAPTAGRPLNDTGASSCSDATRNELLCNDAAVGTDSFPYQDAEFGRDVTANDDSDGHAGFAFTKLDADGTPLADQSNSYADEPWSCVRDEVTGLVWEVKTADTSLHGNGWSYTWYSPVISSGGGGQGVPSGGECVDGFPGLGCDTHRFAEAVNAEAFCGSDDWRLPTRGELLSIVNYGAVRPDGVTFVQLPLIDLNYFPNAGLVRAYWTRDAAAMGGLRRYVSFATGESVAETEAERLYIRLVRGGGSQ